MSGGFTTLRPNTAFLVDSIEVYSYGLLHHRRGRDKTVFSRRVGGVNKPIDIFKFKFKVELTGC